MGGEDGCEGADVDGVGGGGEGDAVVGQFGAEEEVGVWFEDEGARFTVNGEGLWRWAVGDVGAVKCGVG